jgi:hypothetical protein
LAVPGRFQRELSGIRTRTSMGTAVVPGPRETLPTLIAEESG